MIIYLATAPNGKQYVGQTTNTLKLRKAQHLSQSKNPKRGIFHYAVRKYGDQMKWEVIDLADNQRDLDAAEIAAIKERAPEYNLQEGGNGGKPTAKARENMSRAQSGKTLTPEHKANIAAAQRGKKRTPEQCARISKAQKGIPKLKLRGRKKTPEHIAKVAAAQRGKKLTPEQCAQMSAARKGKKKPPQTRARMSAGQKRRHAKNRQRKTGMLV